MNQLHILAELLCRLVRQQLDQDKAHGDDDQECEQHQHDSFEYVFTHASDSSSRAILSGFPPRQGMLS